MPKRKPKTKPAKPPPERVYQLDVIAHQDNDHAEELEAVVGKPPHSVETLGVLVRRVWLFDEPWFRDDYGVKVRRAIPDKSVRVVKRKDLDPQRTQRSR